MSDTVFEAYVKRAIRLLRAAETDSVEQAKILRDVYNRIIFLVESKKEKIENVKDLYQLQDFAEKELDKFYFEGITNEFSKIANVVATNEIKFNIDTIAKFSEQNAKDLFAPLTRKVVRKAAKKEFQGKTFQRWISESFDYNKRIIKKTLVDSYTNGRSIAETVAELRRYSTSNIHDIRSLTRSFYSHNAAEAKDNVFNLNPDIIEGRYWHATLDHRTTPTICGLRDGHEWDMDYKPVGHSIPWDAGPGRIHFNCRSIELPKIKGVSTYSNRPAVVAGEDYERGDNKNARGKIRKPIKKLRDDNVFEIKQLTTRTDYEGFLKGQAKKNLDYVADILGSEKAAIDFRDGKVTLYDLGKQNPLNTPLNRAQL